MRIELVEYSIESVVIDTVEIGIENVDERRAPDPIGHSVLRGRRNQSVEHHRTGQLAHRLRQATVVQNTVKIETLPELKADMDRPGFTMLLSGDPRRIDGDQLPAAGRLRWRLLPSLLHLTKDGVDFGIALIDEATLTKQSIFDLARKTEPLFARPWAEVAERANRFLARPLWGLHRLDQDVIGVRPAFVGAGRFADIHLSPRLSSSHYRS